jgi:2-polyprenyl-3-methyl-5-hydroxy-6-metoxy-1,4-benzoquinol methylase
MLDVAAPVPCCPFAPGPWETIHEYRDPPDGETRFDSPLPYERRLSRCRATGHVISTGAIAGSVTYDGAYVEATYGKRGVREAFERVMNLPVGASDNQGRVECVDRFVRARSPDRPRRLLDVGAGLGVYPATLATRGWACTALDPDPIACRHLRKTVKVDVICADFAEAVIGERAELVTFNKVLEHVLDPERMLAAARAAVVPGGIVYVELPDAESAFEDGPGREEFFIEHHHVFSLASMILMARRAGFRTLHAERLIEPSGKHTLRSFLVAIHDGGSAAGRQERGA